MGIFNQQFFISISKFEYISIEWAWYNMQNTIHMNSEQQMDVRVLLVISVSEQKVIVFSKVSFNKFSNCKDWGIVFQEAKNS